MKRFTLIVCFIFLLLWLIVAVPVSTAATISSISPSTGYTDGKTRTYTITGTNFDSTEGDVWLEMSGEGDIDAYDITSWDKYLYRLQV